MVNAATDNSLLMAYYTTFHSRGYLSYGNPMSNNFHKTTGPTVCKRKISDQRQSCFQFPVHLSVNFLADSLTDK